MQTVTKWMVVLIATGILLLSSLAGGQFGVTASNGDGSGGGQDNPLAIESSIPANGASGVASLEYIKIVFNKNVAYLTLREKNMQCVSLWSGSQRIPAEIIIADDQVEREKRNDVLIKPKQSLKAGTTYRVEIAPEMQSKSGVILGQKATITFTMAAGSQAPTPGTPGKDQPSAPDTQGSSLPGSAAPVPVDKAITGNENGETAQESVTADQDTTSSAGSNSNTFMWIVLGVAAAALGVVAYRRLGR